MPLSGLEYTKYFGVKSPYLMKKSLATGYTANFQHRLIKVKRKQKGKVVECQ